ncbi:MAG: guanylate kinase [Dethiosulfovibrio peptidovorans]|nr:MAG: guanylate kinase [Dethiosulfovibrio peptidovorans]
MNDRWGTLVVLSGPSGAGKGTVRKELFRRVSGLSFSISCTTRAPRVGEQDGVDYRFMDDVEFLRLIDDGRFLEWAQVHGNYYGTLLDDVSRELAQGYDVVLEIDVQGALQVLEKCPQTVSVFLKPPSSQELERRLRERASEDEGTIALRLQNALEEIEYSNRYDHVVVNDDLERAVSELETIIMACRAGRS